VGGEKMSKSKLTGIAPSEITDVFGSDAFRYYFLRAITFGSDGSFSWEDLSARYEAELANGLGNLASRLIAMVTRYREGVIPEGTTGRTEADEVIATIMRDSVAAADVAMHAFAPHDALAQIWRIVEGVNGYITEQEPWVLAKDDAHADRLNAVLYTAADALRCLAVVLTPFMPQATQKLWSALGAGASVGDIAHQNIPDAGTFGVLPVGSHILELLPLFPRIEQEL